MPAIRSGPGATAIGAEAVKPAPVAVTVPRPPFAAAVSATAAPARGWTVPSPAGATVQVGLTGTGLPNWSVPIAFSVVVPPAATVRAPVVTFIATGAPARIVSDCVPLVTPAAEAVIVEVPAFVSR